MSYLTISQEQRANAPFRIERFLREDKPNRFVPEARLLLTPALKESGLLTSLTDEGAHTVLAILACVTENGTLRPSVLEIAGLLGLSDSTVRERLHRMSGIAWQDEPLLMLQTAESGQETVTLSPLVVNAVDGEDMGEIVLPPLPEDFDEPPIRASVRDRVIAHSREKYARPREEVERDILRQLGHYPEEAEAGPVGDAWRRLSALGVPNDYVKRVIDAYPLEEIENQLDWLKYRDARNPARYIVAAIEGRYDPPARVRLEQAIDALPPVLSSPNANVVEDSEATVEIEEIPAVGEAHDLKIPAMDEADADHPAD